MKTYNAQESRNAGGVGLVLLNGSWELVHGLWVVSLVSTIADGLTIGGDTWSWGSIG